FRTRLIVSAVLGAPVIAISMVMSWHFPGWHWLILALSLPVVTWGAWPFHEAAFKAARGFSSTMDTLISVGVITATLYSLWTVFAQAAAGNWVLPHNAHVWFEAAVAVTVFLLAGRVLEHRA
ncbi:heavy metal translocating P-type ATPase, partial [Brevibacterium paucivorans]